MITSIHEYGQGPVLISFHGLNGTYNDSATLVSKIEAGLDFPFRVFAPQLGDNDWGKDDIAYVFKYVRALGITDIHIVGTSLGGMAVIRAMYFNETFPEDTKLNILSVGVVCGKDDKKDFITYSKYKIKCWHAPDDPRMTITSIRIMVEEVKKLDGDIELIELPVGTGHAAWIYAYDHTIPDNYVDWVKNLVNPPTEPQREDIIDQYVKGDELITVTSSGVYKIKLA